MSSRRSFLKQAAVLAPAAFMVPDQLLANRKKNQEVGIQLYTLREILPQDPRGVLGKVAAAGYTNVELYGYENGKFFGMPVKEFAAYTKSIGLKSASGHYMPQKFVYGNGEEGMEDLNEMIGVAHE